jgi:hypothetical protein
MSEQEAPRSSTSGIVIGTILILVGVFGGIGIPILMTGGDKGDAGLIYFLMGVPIGLLFAVGFIAGGIVVLVKANKPQVSEPTP